MAVVTYTCDVCKRSIDVPQNKKGLDVIQRCIITDQCKGKLHQESVNIDYSRGSLPPNVEGLTNWVQRKLLFNYSQTVNKEIWEINHNLNCLPVVVVYVLDESVSPAVLKEISLDEITLDIISNNQIKLTFSKPVSGQVQCIARATSATSTTSTSTTTIKDFQITNNGELSIASNNNVYGASNYIVLDFVFTTPTGLTITVPYSVDTTPSFQSPWSETTTLFIKNTKYKTRSFGAATATPFLDNSIPNGSVLTGVSTSSTNDDIIILLANSPYSVFDVIDNEYISFKNIDGNVYVNDGELFAPASIIEHLQPAIIPITI